ncbi:MAG: M23 family metallopeptidase [Solirubrobacterales bacterium]
MRRLGKTLVATAVALASATSTAHAQDGWVWPVRGTVITPYSNDNARPYAGGMHRGIDIAAAAGTPVAVASGGEVSYAGNLGSSGLTVAVRTQDARHVTSYLHLSTIAVSRGQRVDAGTRLGAVGTSGGRSVEQPHLHFGVRLADRDNFYLDPLSLLPPLGVNATGAPIPAPATAPERAAEAPVPSPRPQGATQGVRARRPTLRPSPATGRGRSFQPLPARRANRATVERGAPVSQVPRAVSAGPPVHRSRARIHHPTAVSGALLPEPRDGRPWGGAAILLGAALVLLVTLGGGISSGIRSTSQIGMLTACRAASRLRSGWIAATSKPSTRRSPRAATRIGPPRLGGR